MNRQGEPSRKQLSKARALLIELFELEKEGNFFGQSLHLRKGVA